LRTWLEAGKEQDRRSFLLCKTVECLACNGTGKDVRLFMDWKGNIMKLLLTSSGISNDSIRNALVESLGKPIAESSALYIPTAIYPFPGGAAAAARLIRGVAG